LAVASNGPICSEAPQIYLVDRIFDSEKSTERQYGRESQVLRLEYERHSNRLAKVQSVFRAAGRVTFRER
jgi:hypothetical protein